jgi:hypothetical protein
MTFAASYAAHSQLAGGRPSFAENNATGQPSGANLFSLEVVLLSKGADSGVQL